MNRDTSGGAVQAAPIKNPARWTVRCSALFGLLSHEFLFGLIAIGKGRLAITLSGVFHATSRLYSTAFTANSM